MSHTPGPWVVDETNQEMVAILFADVYHYIADCDAGYEQQFSLEEIRANARLIAAAPALLEACEASEALLTTGDVEYDDMVPVVEKLHAAIRLAKEGQ